MAFKLVFEENNGNDQFKRQYICDHTDDLINIPILKNTGSGSTTYITGEKVTYILTPSNTWKKYAEDSGGGGDDDDKAWEPSADMKWGKALCENDINTDDLSLDTYKVFQYFNNDSISDSITIPAGCAVKTSDGHYYTYAESGSKVEHIWMPYNEHDSEDQPGTKLRWIITYYYNDTPYNIIFLDEVIYVCLDSIKIKGPRFYDKYLLQYFDVINGSDLDPRTTNIDKMFSNCYSLQSIPLLNTSNIVAMTGTFTNCESLKNVPLLDTSKVTRMDNMFNSCKALKVIPAFNTENVNTMSKMFQTCLSLETIPLLNTSNVTNMSFMFSNCYKLATIPLLDMHNVANMTSMFSNCSALTSLPAINTSAATNMSSLFYYCTCLHYIPRIDISKAATVYMMFYTCPCISSISVIQNNAVPIDMGYFIAGCQLLAKVSGLNLMNATSVSSFFSSCAKLEDLDIRNITKSINITSCTKLSRQTLLKIINNLVDLTGQTGQTLTLGSTNRNKLSDEDISIALSKNWTIA